MTEDLRRPSTPTPQTVYQVLDALQELDIELRPDKPRLSKAALIVLAGHSAGETDHWRKMYQFNIGNVKSNRTTPYCYQPTTEVLSPKDAERLVAAAGRREDDPTLPDAAITAKKPAVYDEDGKLVTPERWIVRFWPPNPVAAFRAFDSLKDGMRDHFKFLLQPRFAKAMAAAAAGDAATYVNELYAQGYFTQFLSAYRTMVVSLFKEYMLKLKDWEPDVGETVYRSDLIVTPFSLQSITQDIIEEDMDSHGIEKDEAEGGPSSGVEESGGGDSEGNS